MILTQQINFLTKCAKNMDKFQLYLNIGDKKISCEPSLALKKYYKWSLKYLYNEDMEEGEIEGYLKKIIEKEDYKALIKMEYTDFRNLVVAYYSLGEMYFHENQVELAKEYFVKVIEILEETLKSGNRYAHTLMIEKDDVSFFELMMWAKKNLADMREDTASIEEYDGIISEGELLYLQKNYSIYIRCKKLEIVDRAYEAARSIIKVYPEYENVNIDAVEFLRESKSYYNALDIAINEYKRTEEDRWVELVESLCEKHENFNIQCLEKVINFLDLLLWNLKLSSWGSIAVKLYEAIDSWDTALNQYVRYLNSSLNKVNYKTTDFSYFPHCIDIINKVFNHIKLNKYENKELRSYEFNFTFLLLNAAMKNKNYEDVFESVTKLNFISGENNEEKKYIETVIGEYKKTCIENLTLEREDLQEKPWLYLWEKLDYSIKQYDEAKDCPLLGINAKVSDMKNESDLKVNFYNFKDSIFKEISNIEENITREDEIVSNKLKVMEEGIYENKTIETGIDTDLKEFEEKIKNDLEFLKEYSHNKMSIAIPDLLEKNLSEIDKFEDIKTVRSLSEEKFKEVIIKWCDENLNSLLWEQFNVYLAKYKNIYLEHMSIIKNIEENRKTVATVYEEFTKEILPIEIKTPEEVLESFKSHYSDFSNGVNYDINIFPQESLVQNFAHSAKGLFKKPEDKIQILRSRIKTTIIEVRLDITNKLVGNIFKGLEDLCLTLQKEVHSLFGEILKYTTKDIEIIEKNYDKVKLYYEDLKKRNEEMDTLLGFIKAEVNKYEAQLSYNIIYSNGKCYRVKGD